MGTVDQAIALIDAQIGVKENPPGSNRQPYGPAEAWCVLLIDWVMGQTDTALPIETASVYALANEFSRRGQLSKTPQRGAIGFYRYGDGHAVLVESFDGTYITDVSGNTSASDGTNPNGGQVARHKRLFGNVPVIGFAMPYYSPPASPAQPQEDDMGDPRVITWATGMKTIGKPTGAIDNWGNQLHPQPSYGSLFSLRPDERQALNWPLGPDDFEALIPVTDITDPASGYIACVIGKDGHGYQFKLDAAFLAAHPQ